MYNGFAIWHWTSNCIFCNGTQGLVPIITYTLDMNSGLGSFPVGQHNENAPNISTLTETESSS